MGVVGPRREWALLSPFIPPMVGLPALSSLSVLHFLAGYLHAINLENCERPAGVIGARARGQCFILSYHCA